MPELEDILNGLKKNIRRSLLDRGLKPLLEVKPGFIKLRVKNYSGIVSLYPKSIEATIYDRPGEENQTLDLLREALEACDIKVFLYSELYRDLI